MNQDIIKGTWKQISGEAKRLWGKLTDDELDQTEGQAEKLAGLVQAKYGRTKQEADREVNEFLERHQSNTDIAQGTWGQLVGEAKRLWGKLTDDELTEAKGNTEKLTGLVQERYGRSKQEAEQEVNDFFSKHGKH